MSSSELLSNSLLLLMGATPLAALSVIAFRSRRGRWWTAAPWLLLAALWLILLQIFYSTRLIGPEEARLESALVGTGFMAAWLTLVIFLVALTIAGPKLPPPGVVKK